MSRTLSWPTQCCTQQSRDDFLVSLVLSEHLLAPQMYLVSIFANSKRVSALLALEVGIAARGKLHAFVRGWGTNCGIERTMVHDTSASSGASLRIEIEWSTGVEDLCTSFRFADKVTERHIEGLGPGIG